MQPEPIAAPPPVARPGVINDLREIGHDLVEHRDLLLQLTRRDLKVRYKQAAMGFAWAVFMPLLIVLAGILVRVIMAQLSGSTVNRAAPYSSQAAPSQAAFARERVGKTHATWSHTSSRTERGLEPPGGPVPPPESGGSLFVFRAVAAPVAFGRPPRQPAGLDPAAESRFRGGRVRGGAADEVSLRGHHPRGGADLQILGGLDAFRDQAERKVTGQSPERLQD